MTGIEWETYDGWHGVTTDAGITVELSSDGTRVVLSNGAGDAIDLPAEALVSTADTLLAAHVKRSRL